MAVYLLRRLASMAFVLFCVVTITFGMIRSAPGGPFDRERKTTPAIERALKLKHKLESPEGRALGESVAGQLHLGGGQHGGDPGPAHAARPDDHHPQRVAGDDAGAHFSGPV